MTRIQKNRFIRLCQELTQFDTTNTVVYKTSQKPRTFQIYYTLPMTNERKQLHDVNPYTMTIEDLIQTICKEEKVLENMTACLFTDEGIPLTDDSFFNTWSLIDRSIADNANIFAIFTLKENVPGQHFSKGGSAQDKYSDPNIGDSTIHCDVSFKETYDIKVNLKKDTIVQLREKLSIATGIPREVFQFRFSTITGLENVGVQADDTEHVLLSLLTDTGEIITKNYIADIKASEKQSDSGICNFFSSLHVVISRNGDHELLKVISLIHRLTGFTPLTLSLYDMSKKMILSNSQKVAVVEGLYLLFKKILNSAKMEMDENVFEHSNSCWASLMNDAKEITQMENFANVNLKCSCCNNRLTEPVQISGIPGLFEKRIINQKLKDNEAISGCSVKDLSPDKITKATDRQRDVLCLRPKLNHYNMFLVREQHQTVIQEPKKKTLSELHDSVQTVGQLHIVPPLCLKALGIPSPAITFLSKEKTGVYLEKDKETPCSAKLFNVENGKEVSIDIDELAARTSNFQKEDSSVHVGLSRNPAEAIMVLMDNSLSMSSASFDDPKSVPRMDAAKQLFHAFADRTMAYDFHHVVGLITFAGKVTVVGKFGDLLERFKNHVDGLVAQSDTKLYDALNEAVVKLTELRKEFPECKLRILCLTDGEDMGSKATADSVNVNLLREDILVDSVIVGRTNNQTLHTISNATGGCCFRPKSIEEGYTIFEAETVLSLQRRQKKPKIASSVFTTIGYLKTMFGKKKEYDAIPAAIMPPDVEKKVSCTSRIINKEEKKPVLPSTFQSRILEELKILHRTPHPYVTVYPCESNTGFWKILLQGPQKTPYHSGVFLLYVKFMKSYPVTPPEIRFITPIYHCNINSSGRICHNILDRNYSAQITMKDILDAVFGLLIAPEPSDPLDSCLAEEYLTNAELYRQHASEHTAKHAGKTLEQWQEDLLSEEEREVLPDHLVCTLTKKLFVEPVVTPYGTVYEHRAIEEHLARCKTDPKTGKALDISSLKPERTVKKCAERYRELQERI
ncbi:unnamed protein product, partial [Lampetra planeri]